MPAIGVGMTDQQIADVTNYVRQALGNTAPPNAGPGMVGDLRRATAAALYRRPVRAMPPRSPRRRSAPPWPILRPALPSSCTP